ncbi:MAG TPA: radical SAM family heme chaperone HemW [Coriobacteriia bacterium]|nr:radical SAM family heme chaperone HemW [Coriobacteriia bacterium]
MNETDFFAQLGDTFGDAARLPAHMYVHVPFCASKCSYCDFASEACNDPDRVRAVFTGIRAQLRQWSNSGLEGVLETIYYGGGTPSLHPDWVADTLGYIREQFTVHPSAEITVEANPDSLSRETLALLMEQGVTRISVGVQSFDARVLGMLGRRHDAIAAWRACETVIDAGLALSVDLICGVPGQSEASWAETLRRAVDTEARHISVYPLSVEEGTALATAIDSGLVAEPDPDTAADMMVMARDALALSGFERYEVANYAKSPADQSRHNNAYWTGRSYIGIGPGAHGMLDAPTAMAAGMAEGLDPAARLRYANSGEIDEWMVGVGDSHEVLTPEEVAREDIMLGLRLAEGVAEDDVEAAGLTEDLEKLAELGLVERVDARWHTTTRGWLLGNEVFSRIWLGDR